jgi:carboxyvinyl-carboxyphosphonate phosphorylmutase
MTATARRLAFRAVLGGASCVHPASVFDPVSARIAADLGFETGILAGSTASLTVLGAPDLIVLTLSEFAAQIRRITRAADLPLLVDADHGYGNALNAMRTVQELENAGVAALTIEDTTLPRPHGPGASSLVSHAEGLGKLRAALAAREDATTVIVARTSAVSVTGLDDAVARVRLYTAAGADALFFTGVTALDQLRAIRAASDLPIILGGGNLPGGREAMAAHGVRLALQGHQPIFAAMRAVHDTLAALRDGTAPSALTGQPTPAQIRQWTRADLYDDATRDFLGG